VGGRVVASIVVAVRGGAVDGGVDGV
jgi:hypothetical protein